MHDIRRREICLFNEDDSIYIFPNTDDGLDIIYIPGDQRCLAILNPALPTAYDSDADIIAFLSD